MLPLVTDRGSDRRKGDFRVSSGSGGRVRDGGTVIPLTPSENYGSRRDSGPSVEEVCLYL